MKQRLWYFLAAWRRPHSWLSGRRARPDHAAEGYTPPDDTPTVKVGGTIFADYTYQQRAHGDGRRRKPDPPELLQRHPRLHQRHRQISHLVSFRITPDVVRVGQVPSSGQRRRAGSDRDTDLSSQVRVRTAQLRRLHDERILVPPRHAADAVHRLRRGHLPLPVPGHVFVDREGFLSSSDLGASVHWTSRRTSATSTSASTTARATRANEVNDQKAFRSAGRCGRCR